MVRKIISILLLLIVGIILFSGCSSTTNDNKQVESPQGETNQDNFAENNFDNIDAKMNEKLIKDCEKDFSCFVSAAETCYQAKFNYVIETNIFGVLQMTDSSYELMKTDDEKCSLKLVTNKIDLKYSQELLDMMKQGGATQEEIDKQLEETKKQYDTFIGKEGVCTGEINVISSLLKRWEEGSFSTSDWDNLECSGSYFEQMQSEVKATSNIEEVTIN